MGLPILYFKGSQVEVIYYDVFLSLKVALISVNSADLDEIFHLGLLCLPKYPFRGFPVYKGLNTEQMDYLILLTLASSFVC